jgi:glycosyltransferase involved in cell wall biosynthesis|tara:strand:- start:9572 stop:10843 length:1272 start_codon:yes stop_codon:yes gene_type:complete
LSDKKIKILTISDHPLLPSGVGTQTKYIIQALLNTGKFQVLSMGGAIKHPDYSPTKTEDYGDDWVIIPVDGYGNQEQIRQYLNSYKPDILYFMTDPRFYDWLWHMEDEVRENVPMIYYHVWDNYPAPLFNKPWYKSNDFIATISKVTSNNVKEVCPEVEERYIPHSVDTDTFQNLDKHPDGKKVVRDAKEENPATKGKFIFFWNNRNARRKQSGTLIYWFKKFLDKVGHDKACLIMHTDINDPNGQPLEYITQHLGLTNGQVIFSKNKVAPQQLSVMYNMADCTVNIADAEGFGLGTLESLACETPIIVNMTGGLQEQVTDGENWFGIGIEPASKAIIGSLSVPYIREDRLNEDDVVDAMYKMYSMSEEERRKLGKAGREHVLKNYNFENFCDTWIEVMTELHENHGSWETRKNYQKWELLEV